MDAMSTEVQPLRSFLFAPGNHARRVEKALTLDADAVILDLEDAVATAEKPATRETIAAALERPRRGLLCPVMPSTPNSAMAIWWRSYGLAWRRHFAEGRKHGRAATVDWLLAQPNATAGCRPRHRFEPDHRDARGVDRPARSRRRHSGQGAPRGRFHLDVNMAGAATRPSLPMPAPQSSPHRARRARAARHGGRCLLASGRRAGRPRAGLRLPRQDVHPSRPDRDREPGLHAKR